MTTDEFEKKLKQVVWEQMNSGDDRRSAIKELISAFAVIEKERDAQKLLSESYERRMTLALTDAKNKLELLVALEKECDEARRLLTMALHGGGDPVVYWRDVRAWLGVDATK